MDKDKVIAKLRKSLRAVLPYAQEMAGAYTGETLREMDSLCREARRLIRDTAPKRSPSK